MGTDTEFPVVLISKSEGWTLHPLNNITDDQSEHIRRRTGVSPLETCGLQRDDTLFTRSYYNSRVREGLNGISYMTHAMTTRFIRCVFIRRMLEQV